MDLRHEKGRPEGRPVVDGGSQSGTRRLLVSYPYRSEGESMRLYSDRIDSVEIAFASIVAVSFIALLASMAWLLFG